MSIAKLISRTWKSVLMTFKASWGRCSMGQTTSVHTACLMIVPLHLMNSMGENCVCFSSICPVVLQFVVCHLFQSVFQFDLL